MVRSLKNALWGVVLLLLVFPAFAVAQEPLVEVTAALETLDGFKAQYEAKSARGTTYTIIVRYSKPNKMRVDVDPLDVTTAFNGDTYTYFDRKSNRAILMHAVGVQAELRKQQGFFEEISWFSTGSASETAGTAVYPNFVLGLSPEHLDLALEMATTPHQHSWVQALAQADDVRRDGNAVTFTQPGSNGRVHLRVGTTSGLLLRAELRGEDEAIGTIELKEFKREVPPDSFFDFVVPSSVDVRDHDSDPLLLQQLLVTSFRGTLDTLLSTARKKWATLRARDKKELRHACLRSFEQIFELAQKQAREGVRASLFRGELPGRIRRAADDTAAKKSFAGDHPELTGAALDDAWKKQLINELTRDLLFEIMRGMDAQLVGPIRDQVMEKTAGLDDAQRKEIARFVTEPAHQAFTEMVRPTVQRAIREILG